VSEAAPYYVQLGARIRDARKAAELTQTELAAEVGLERSSIANMEAGRQQPSADRVMAIGMALGADPRWLLTGWGRIGLPNARPGGLLLRKQRARIHTLATDLAKIVTELEAAVTCD
jgi:transcriptional regulator with XRE-family HTH domain